MEKNEVENIAKSWIGWHESKKGEPSYESEFWAFQAMDELTHEKPLEALVVILRIADLAETEEVLGYLGAGPIEDVMLYHGQLLIERIATEAQIHPKFKRALKTVQLEKSDTPVRERFYEIAETEPYV